MAEQNKVLRPALLLARCIGQGMLFLHNQAMGRGAFLGSTGPYPGGGFGCLRMPLLVLSALFASIAFAAPISIDQVKTIAGGVASSVQVSSASGAAIHCAQSVPVAETSVFAVVPTNSEETAFYVVNRQSTGGFVVISADDRLEPVLAIAPTGSFDAIPGSPLYDLLCGDVRQRIAMADNNEAGRSYGWNMLLADSAQGGNTMSAAYLGIASIDDVRVGPLVESKWNQSTVSGKNVYNYYTPKNYVCGCVATAGSQIMRCFRYPTGSITTLTRTCTVDGTEVSQTMKGGTYDWDNMPLVPTSSISDAEREAIGKLCFNVGVAVSMSWNSGGSGAYGFDLGKAFTSVFGYKNAKYWQQSQQSTISDSIIKNGLLANFDAKCPVELTISYNGRSSFHSIVADGYGYSAGRLYVHLNIGWGDGGADVWYNLPDMSGTYYGSSFAFNMIDGVVYNIFTKKTGDLLTGRVTDAETRQAISGATVQAMDGSIVAGVAKTSDTGIYALWLPGGKEYTVVASASGTESASKSVYLEESISHNYYHYEYGKVGNSWGNDFELTSAGEDVDPEAPLNVSASDGTSTARVRVTWSPSTSATHYKVFRAESNSSSAAVLLAPSVTSTYYDDESAVVGTTYYYWVKACNSIGESAFSESDSGWRAYAVPDSPSYVSASDGTSSEAVHVTWGAVQDAESYSVWRATSSSSSAAEELASGLTGTSYSDTSAVPGVTYHYWVKATNSGGTSGFGVSDSGSRAVAAPSAPTGVSASDGWSSTEIVVTWSAVESAESYSVWRAAKSSPSDRAELVADLSGTSYSDTSAAPGITYLYWVRATNTGGTSDFSSSDEGSLAGISGPGTVSASDGDYADYVKVSWQASQGAMSYEVWRGTVNAYSKASKIRTVTATSYNDTNAQFGILYYYWVRAVTSAGESAFSSSDSGYRPLNVPSGVSATTGKPEGVTVSWSSVAGATSYEVGRGSAGASAPTIPLGTAASTSFKDATGVPGVTYAYFVRAVASACSSGWSASATGSRSIPTPKELSASDGTYSDRIFVSWPELYGAERYELMRSSENDISFAETIATTTGTSYSDTTAEYGLTYYYFLRAIFAAGTSPWSAAEAGSRAFPAPTHVSASDGANVSRITITWDEIEGATLFQIWRYSVDRRRNELVGTSTKASYNDSKGINPGVKYSYQVMAVFPTGTSKLSDADTGYLKSPAPTVSASDGTSTSQISLSWSESVGARSYLIYRGTTSSSSDAMLLTTKPMTEFEYVDTQAAGGTLYYYWVKAATKIDTSDFGYYDSGYVALPGVPRVSATDGEHEGAVIVTWDAVSGATSYEVYRGTSYDDYSGAEKIASKVTTTSYRDEKMTPGMKCWYWVRACDAGPGFWGACDSGYSILSTPTDVTATTNNTDGVKVTWKGTTSGVSFEIKRGFSDDVEQATVVATLSDKNNYLDNTTIPGCVYYYWVRSYSDLIESDWSSVVSGFRAVSPPATVSATDGTSLDAVTVTWASATSAKRYEIWRSTTTKDADAELLGTTNRLVWVDSEAEPGVAYYYWIKSISALDTSAFSGRDVGYVSTPEPTDVAASDGESTDYIRISWTESEGALSYAVWRAESENVDEASQIKTDIKGGSYDDNSVTPGKYYWYWVRPVSAPGPGVFVGPDQGYSLLSAPTDLAATSNNTTRVTVSWRRTTGADSYEIFRAETNDLAYATNDVLATVTTLNYADTNAFPAVKYWYWVRACAEADISPFAGPADGFRLLTAPTGVSASDGISDAHIQITWDETEGAASYEVWRAENSTSTSAASLIAGVTNELEYLDTSATAGVSYTYWVKAVSDLYTTGFSSYDKGWRSAYAPETVTASDGTTSEGVAVEWSPVDGALKYEVWRGDDATTNGASRVFTSADASVCVYTNTSAKAGVKYWFWVRTVSATGTGVFSEPDDGFRAVAAPTNLKATDGSSYDYVRVTWGAAAGAESYEILRSPTNELYEATNVYFSVTGTSFDDTNAVPGVVYRYSVRTISPLSNSDYAGPDEGYRKLQKITDVKASDGASLDAVELSWTVPEGALKCQVWRNTGTSAGSAEMIATVEGGTYSDTTALHGEKYYYWVNAVTDVEGEMGGYDDGWRGLIPPGDVVATDGDSTSHARITWTFSQDATKYEILRGTTDDISAMSSLRVLTSPNELVWEDSTAVAGTLYYYAVRAGGDGGWSEPSATDVGYKMLMPPSSVAATDGTLSGQVRVTWKSVTGATHYLVYRADSETAEKTAWSGWQTETTFIDTSCQGATKYWYYVVAAADENGARPSAISAGDTGYAKDSGTSATPVDLGGGISWPVTDNGDGTTTTNAISFSSISDGRVVFPGVYGAVNSTTTVHVLVKTSISSESVYTVEAPLQIISSGTAELDLSSVWGTRTSLFVIGISTEKGAELP